MQDRRRDTGIPRRIWAEVKSRFSVVSLKDSLGVPGSHTGYDQGGAVDSELHIWNSNSGAWIPSFIPPSATPPPTSTDPLSSTASASLDPTHTESSTKVGASTSGSYAPDHTKKVPGKFLSFSVK